MLGAASRIYLKQHTASLFSFHLAYSKKINKSDIYKKTKKTKQNKKIKIKKQKTKQNKTKTNLNKQTNKQKTKTKSKKKKKNVSNWSTFSPLTLIANG